jgi:hypothetical protein
MSFQVSLTGESFVVEMRTGVQRYRLFAASKEEMRRRADAMPQHAEKAEK